LLLRVSGEQAQTDYDLRAITSGSGDGGVADGYWLRTLTEQTIRGEWDTLALTRQQANAAIGEQQCVDVLTVAAAFNGITRVADATGIPLDHNTTDTTDSMRASTGIDKFSYAEKSARYDSADE
jgi:hypothetical protein